MFRKFMLHRSRILSLTGATVLTAILAVIGAGCGSSDSGIARASGGSAQEASSTSTTSSSGGSRDEKLLQFAKCMRTDGGVPDFPDPTTDENGDLQLARPSAGNNGNDNRQDIRGGFEKCQQYLDGVISPPSEADQTAIRDAQLEFAKCMRGEGVNVPDPDPNQQGPGAFADIDRDDPNVQAAMEKCRPIFQNALGDRGPGGGGPGGGAGGGQGGS